MIKQLLAEEVLKLEFSRPDSKLLSFIPVPLNLAGQSRVAVITNLGNPHLGLALKHYTRPVLSLVIGGLFTRWARRRLQACT